MLPPSRGELSGRPVPRAGGPVRFGRNTQIVIRTGVAVAPHPGHESTAAADGRNGRYAGAGPYRCCRGRLGTGLLIRRDQKHQCSGSLPSTTVDKYELSLSAPQMSSPAVGAPLLCHATYLLSEQLTTTDQLTAF